MSPRDDSSPSESPLAGSSRSSSLGEANQRPRERHPLLDCVRQGRGQTIGEAFDVQLLQRAHRTGRQSRLGTRRAWEAKQGRRQARSFRYLRSGHHILEHRQTRPQPDALQCPRRPPTSRVDAYARAGTSRPSSTMLPARGGTKPQTTLKSVVLPAPFGPITPTTSPRPTLNDTPASAANPPNMTLTSRTTRPAGSASATGAPTVNAASSYRAAARSPSPTRPAGPTTSSPRPSTRWQRFAR